MSQTKLPKITLALIVAVAVIIVLVPFHALLTVWLASLTGHYTAWRLWDELVLLLAALGAAGLLWLNKGIQTAFKRQPVFWLIGFYALLQLAVGGVSWLKHDVSPKALGYGLIVDLRFLLFFAVCWLVAVRQAWLKQHWQQLLLIPAAIVVVFGLLQHFVLPDDFLRHFGYRLATIPPYETINQNTHYVRIISTLRGANPLGAYLVVIISALSAVLVNWRGKWRWAYVALLAGAIVTLFYSYSRSAWIGAAIGMALVLALSLKNPRVLRGLAAGTGILIVAAGISLFALRHSSRLQDTIFHTDTSHQVPTTSNEGHISALKSGLKDVLHQPLGDGPGTAGPASAYNNHPARIAENYFVQIAQEVGWLGLALFLAIYWVVARSLWARRDDTLSLALLASLIGIAFIGLLSHVWVDDTLSYIWWGLAGIASASVVSKRQTK